MTFSIVTDFRTRRALSKVDKKIRKADEEDLDQVLHQIGSNLVRIGENQALNEPKFGREYPRYENGSRIRPDHRASAPGQSPAFLSGNYFESFKYEARTNELEFGNNADYAEFLEEGVPENNLLPRPGVINAVNASVGTIRMYFDTYLEDLLDLED